MIQNKSYAQLPDAARISLVESALDHARQRPTEAARMALLRGRPIPEQVAEQR